MSSRESPVAWELRSPINGNSTKIQPATGLKRPVLRSTRIILFQAHPGIDRVPTEPASWGKHELSLAYRPNHYMLWSDRSSAIMSPSNRWPHQLICYQKSHSLAALASSPPTSSTLKIGSLDRVQRSLSGVL